MELLISGVANLEPPSQLFPGGEQRRRHREVGPVAPASGRLDRYVVVSAQVSVADPHPDIRRQTLVPDNLNRRPRLPLQACAICLTSSQKYLPARSCLRSRHRAPSLHLHIRLIAKQRMCAPIGQQRLGPVISVCIRKPDPVLAKLNATPQPPWQHSARALERGIVEHRPRQAPRLPVVWQLNTRERTRTRIARRIDTRHHLVPTARSGGDEPKRGRIVDSDALIEKLLARKAKRNDSPTMLGLDLHLPNATPQLHSASDRSV